MVAWMDTWIRGYVELVPTPPRSLSRELDRPWPHKSWEPWVLRHPRQQLREAAEEAPERRRDGVLQERWVKPQPAWAGGRFFVPHVARAGACYRDGTAMAAMSQ